MSSATAVSREVIILQSVAGSAWLEAGRTHLCPTPEWIGEQYGAGRYELRLMSGREVLCVVRVAATERRASRRPRFAAGPRDSLG
jgi:hypothetical protein